MIDPDAERFFSAVLVALLGSLVLGAVVTGVIAWIAA